MIIKERFENKTNLKQFEDMTMGDMGKIHDSFVRLIKVRNNLSITKTRLNEEVETMADILGEVEVTMEKIKVNLE